MMECGSAIWNRIFVLILVLSSGACVSIFRTPPFSGNPPRSDKELYISTEFPDRKYETIAVTQMYKAALSVFGELNLVDVGPQTMVEMIAEEARKHNADGIVIKNIVIPNPPTDAEKAGRVVATAAAIADRNWGAALAAGTRGIDIWLTGELIRFVDE